MESLLHRWVTWSVGVRCPLQGDTVASGSHKAGHRAARSSEGLGPAPSQGGSAPPLHGEARPRPFSGSFSEGLGPTSCRGGGPGEEALPWV